MFMSLAPPVAGICDNFEDDLSQWVGKGGGAHHGVLVEDPLRPGNDVLTFTSLNLRGEVFSPEVAVTRGEMHLLTFEYLGVPNGGVPDDLGGAIGFAEATPSRHRWLGGTIFCCGIESDLLIDDGQWHSYAIEFDVFADGLPNQVYTFSVTPPVNNTIRVMLEDFPGSGGIPGDAFFDNVRLTKLPLEVTVDVKPGSDAVPAFVLGRDGVTPVAVLGSAAFDVRDVEASTLMFGDLGECEHATPVHDLGDPQTYDDHVQDVNEDGYDDLVSHYRSSDTGIDLGDNEVCIEGKTLGGALIGGCDAVRTVQRGRP